MLPTYCAHLMDGHSYAKASEIGVRKPRPSLAEMPITYSEEADSLGHNRFHSSTNRKGVAAASVYTKSIRQRPPRLYVSRLMEYARGT